MWTCAKCGMTNRPTRDHCTLCREPKAGGKKGKKQPDRTPAREEALAEAQESVRQG